MKLAVHFGVYEAEKPFASHTLGRLLNQLAGHDVHVLVLDDASPSNLGAALYKELSGAFPAVTWDVHRIEKSKGYRGLMGRALFALNRIAESDIRFDYFVRVDADLFINRPAISNLFTTCRLPQRGLVGKVQELRWRDYIQILLDLIPIGLQRKVVGDHLEHAWALTRTRPVWWSDIGRKALLHGFGRRFVHGALMIMAGDTLTDLKRSGWLDRTPSASTGLMFGDDVVVSLLVKGLGDPLVDFNEVMPEWRCEMSFDPRSFNISSSPMRDYHVLHPLKGDATSLELRRTLSERFHHVAS